MDSIDLACLDDLDVKVRCSQPSCDYYKCRWCLRKDYPSACVHSGFAWVSDE